MLQKSQSSNHISTHSVEREVYKDMKGKKVTKIRFTKSGKWQDLWDNGPTMPRSVQNDHIFSCRFEGTTVWIIGLIIHPKDTILLFVSLFLKKNRREIDDFYGLSFKNSPSPLPGISGKFEVSSQGWGQ